MSEELTDPILSQIARKVLAARAKAPKVGVTINPADEDAYIREETAKMGKQYTRKDVDGLLMSLDTSNSGGNIIDGVTNGVLMGAAPTLTGLLPKWMGGGREQEQDMRLRMEAYAQAHPGMAKGANIAGGVLSSFAGPMGAVGKAATAGEAALGAAKVGGVLGALQGAGEASEGLQAGRMARGAALGGAVGAAGGAVLGGGSQLLARTFSPAVMADRGLRSIVAKSGGVDALQNTLGQYQAAGRGNNVMLADLSPQARMGLDNAATANNDVLLDAAGKIASRQRNQSGRLLGDVQDLTPVPTSATRLTTAVTTARNAEAKANFGALRDAGKNVPAQTVAPFFQKPEVASAWKIARKAGNITAGQDPVADMVSRLTGGSDVQQGALQKFITTNPTATADDIAKVAPMFGMQAPEAGAARPVTFDDLHAFRQEASDNAGEAFAKGRRAAGEAWKTVRDATDEALSSHLPDYAAAMAKYAQKSQVLRDIDSGLEAWNKNDTRALADHVSTLAADPDRLNALRTGIASKLVDELSGTATNVNAAGRLVKQSLADEQKLRIVFGDEHTFQTFMQRAHLEDEMNKTTGAVTGSATARRLLAAHGEFQPSDFLLDNFTHPAGMLAKGAHLATSAVKGHISGAKSAMLGPQLTTQGGDAITQLLSTLRDGGSPFTPQMPNVGRFGGQVAPAAASSLFNTP